MAQVQVTKSEDPLIKFQQNLKKTQAGMNFAKAIFSPGNGSLNQKFLTETMKALGFPVPKGVQMTLETSQMFTSGQSAYTGYKNYQGIDDMKSVVSPSVSSINLALSILQQAGLISYESETVQMIKVGTDIALIICSFGTNIKAWISLAMDITAIEKQTEAQAMRLAYQGVSGYYQALVNPQAKAAASLFKEYQEGDSGLTTFGFIAKLAEAAPDLWPQFFPQFQSWAPVWDASVTVTASKTNWYGSKAEYTAGYSWKSIRGYTPDQLRNFVFTYLVEPYLYPFLLAEKQYKGRGKLSLLHLFTLCLLGNREYIYHDQGLMPLMLATDFSPFDFGEYQVQDYLNGLQPPNFAKNFAISGDIRKLASVNPKEKNKQMTYDLRSLFAYADQAGRIDILNQSNELRDLINSISTYESWKFDASLGDWNESQKSETLGREKISSGPGGAGAAWRRVKNYFAAMALLDQIRRDTYFKGWEGGRMSDYMDFFSTISDFEQMYRDMQLKMVIRKTNTMALANVAYFLGAKNLSDIKRVTANSYVLKG